MAGNSNLHMSKAGKTDEFYTQLSTIEEELRHYRKYFKGKTVLCNCDDPYESNFFKYFALNFNALGLKKLITTCYATSPITYTQLSLFADEEINYPAGEGKKPYKIEITEVTDANGDATVDLSDVEYLLRNKKNALTLLNEDGDFRSRECIALLNECDIVVTNPPFSLMKEYIPLLAESGKQFLVLGNMNHITFKEIFHYVCDGTPSEVHEWFKVINIAGKSLTAQELRNTAYTGTWLSDAKLHFSKPTCAAYNMAKNYVSGSPIRQEYLETAISWIAARDGLDTIEEYMALHQHDDNANQIWIYFKRVIEWVETIFPVYRKEMKGIEWGLLYNTYKDAELDPDALEAAITRLMADDDVGNKKGIYTYVLDGEERNLSIRAFSDTQKREAYERQKGICPICNKHYEFAQMHGDHIKPWHAGGKTVPENLQMLCRDCNLKKSGQK